MNMKKFSILLFSVVLAMVVTSCSETQAKWQINKLESLVERVEEKGADFSQQEWSEAADKYEQICAKMEQFHYTDEQLQEIGRLKARYYVACAKNMLNSSGSLLNGFLQQVSGAVDGVMDELDDAVDELDAELNDLDNNPSQPRQTDETLDELEKMFE